MTKARIIADYAGTGATTDLATQAELDAVSTVASAALPKAGGTMTGDLIPATPLSNRNMIINGAMQIWQRKTSLTASDGSNEGYNSVDRWYFNFNSSHTGSIDVDKSGDTPDDFNGNSVQLKCASTGSPASGSTDLIEFQTKLEAQNLQHLSYGSSNAKTMTLSWYMKATAFTSPIAIQLLTVDGTVEYFTVNRTPTTSWARYSVTIPGSTSATISNDNGHGFTLSFILSGAQNNPFVQTADSTSWSTTVKTCQDDQGNFVSSTSNYLWITGVQLELGSSATPFEHRSYGDELARCQRYYFLQVEGSGRNMGGLGWYYSSIEVQWVCSFPVTLRTSPSLDYNQGSYYAAGGDGFTQINIQHPGPNSTNHYNHNEMSGTQHNNHRMETNHASAKVAYVAEL